MTHIDAHGFHRTRLHERLAQLQLAMRHIFGEHIDLDPDSVDGQTLGIFAEHISQVDQLAEMVYQGLNISTAFGPALSRLVSLNGLKRKAGQKSHVTLTLGGIPQTRIPQGALVFKADGTHPFITENDATIPANGTIDVHARARDKGACYIPKNTLTKIGTPIYGWHRVTNKEEAKDGTDEETDAQLRMRRAAAIALPASEGTVDAMLAALLALPSVTQARITSCPRGVRIIVEGGEDTAIAQTIWQKKTLGTPLVGEISIPVEDVTGNTHIMRFDRPYQIPVVIQICVHPLANFVADSKEQMTQALLQWGRQNRTIGGKMIASQLYTPLNKIDGAAIISIKLGFSGSVPSKLELHLPDDAIAQFSAENIQIIVETE